MAEKKVGTYIAIVLSAIAAAALYVWCEQADERKKLVPSYTGVDGARALCVKGKMFVFTSAGGVTQMLENSPNGLRAVECKE